MSDVKLGRVGIWTLQLDMHPMAVVRDAVRELEDLGFRTIWIPERGAAIGREPMANAALLLSATRRLNVATGIANVHARTAATMRSGWRTLTEAFPDRFVLGIGVSHQPMVEGAHRHSYGKPYTTMVEYLDAMDSGPSITVPPSTPLYRVLAALGPKMLRLSAQRALGALSYLVPVEHTAAAREILGSGPLLLPVQAVVLETDPIRARELARRFLATYLRLPNYVNHLRRLGWSDAELVDPSDARVDSIVAWGSPHDVVERLRAQLGAGADHVPVQVLTADERSLPIAEWRALAATLLDI